MSKRAEKRALELFPVDMQMCIDGTGEPYEADVNAQRRKYVAFGYEQAEKDTIERAVKWLEEHADEYNGSESAFDHMEEEMITDFRKAMEEE